MYVVALKDSDDKIVAIKVGATRKSISDRLKQLNNEFNDWYYISVILVKEVPNYMVAESMFHKLNWKYFGMKLLKKFDAYSRECYRPSSLSILKAYIQSL